MPGPDQQTHGHTSPVSTPAGHERGLVVRRSRRRQLPALLAIAAFLASYVLGGLTGSMTGWIVPAGIALFSVLAVIGLVDLARSGPRSTALLRIGPAGVEVPEVATVSWSDLDDVRVRPTRWFPGFSVVAFIPRPGVPVPSIPRSRLQPAHV